MGKGRLLTVEEIEKIKGTDKKFVLERKIEGDEVIVTTNGVDWFTEYDEWIATKKCWGLSRGTYKLYEYIEEPRTYKTSEMIAMLEENPKLKFKDERDRQIGMDEDDGFISWISMSTKPSFALTEHTMRNCKWTLIEESKEVTFMEAVKAKKDSKTVKCVLNGDEMVYRDYESWFADDKGRAVSYQEILNGKWYIVEEEK